MKLETGFTSLIAYATAGDPGALPFGLDMVNLQNSALLYLGLSGLVFIIIWILGFRKG
ncbi:cytochrome B6 [Synechococcus sp. Cruz CV12-2-Slac-r]|uniref:cytochrome B6 n=1 Tax=Synechococcus sp. Cruz CV12-2-Slac-r TaxID=2823748 RepID=UPI0020CC9EDF|nr:cytochrome B6 [Synechococcus sp. Cruz CV12-2-Slac-r]MCP9940622.1 cytochrome B6 [Synechococcus sp. Cruz CV12-2-Slac-r]